MFELIDRKRAKEEARTILKDAQVSPRAFFALYLGVLVFLDLCGYLVSLAGGSGSFFNAAELFVTIFTSLLSPILAVGTYLYCLAIRRGQRVEFPALFDGFSFAGKIVLLWLLQAVFIFLWSLLFLVPGVVAAYRYSFAYLNLCENPDLSPMEALELSKKQTTGYKWQLFQLDLSYLGWFILAALPAIITSWLFGASTESLVALSSSPLYLAAELGFFFLVNLLFLPEYNTVQTGYYEIAVRTSGAAPEQGGSASSTTTF